MHKIARALPTLRLLTTQIHRQQETQPHMPTIRQLVNQADTRSLMLALADRSAIIITFTELVLPFQRHRRLQVLNIVI